jgi:hypothetical protein
VTFTALPQFLAAVITRLRACAPLTQLVTGVYDETPAGALAYPHIILDEPFETPDRTFGQGGHQASLTISIFTQSPATAKAGTGKAGFTQGLAIAELALALLTDIEAEPLTVEGHDVVDIDVVNIDCTRETDGKTRRIDATIIATLEDAA